MIDKIIYKCHKKTPIALAIIVAVTLLGLQLDNASLIRGTGPSPAYKEIGLWLNQNTPEDSKIACVEIGTIGWYSKRYIIDILGLVNFHNADLIGKKDLEGWLNYYEPDYILAHDPLWPFEVSVSELLKEGKYAPVSDFRFSGYMLVTKSR